MPPVQRRNYEDSKMQETLGRITDEENKHLWTSILIAGGLYLGTLVVYAVIFLAKESEETVRGLAILYPVFLLLSDSVIVSLREQAVRIRQESKDKLVYSTTFQSIVLLLNRVLLCYNKEYWLFNMAIAYFFVQLIGAYDATETLFLKT